MLRVEHVNAGYGDIQVLWDVSFQVQMKEFVVLVGANGAGKSTIMRTISSIISPDQWRHLVRRPAPGSGASLPDHQSWHRPRP